MVIRLAGKPFSRQAPCPGSGRAVGEPPRTKTRRVECPECDRGIQVHADGTLYEHVRVYTINYPPVAHNDGGDEAYWRKITTEADERNRRAPRRRGGWPMKPMVYLAAPYTNPDPVINTHNTIHVATMLVEDGRVTPIVPHLTLLWHLVTPRPIEFWYAYDLEVMARCDYVVRLAGASTGADAEVREADRLGIPVFYDVDELLAHIEEH